MNLQQFFTDRFNSDPYELLYAAHSDLVSIASAAGIDWNDVAGDIQLASSNGLASKFSKYARRNPAVTNRSHFGRADVYSRIEIHNGIQYPFINFVLKGHDAGSWSGLDYLWSEYRNELERGGTAVPLTQNQLERQKRQAKAKAEREKKSHSSKMMALQLRDQALLAYQDFSKRYNSADTEFGNHPYLVKKGIQAITEFSDIRRVIEWDRGPTPKECLAIPLSKLHRDSPIIGWQRIYEDGRKLQTSAIDTGDYVGACHVIGNLHGAQRVCVAEGFATAASTYIAAMNAKSHFDAVIMAVSANNIPHVVKTLVEEFPAIDVWCALDNDKEKSMIGKGNTGLATGLRILSDYPQVKCVYPIFQDGENGKDYNDLMLLKGIGETKRQIYSNNNKLEVPSNVFESNLQLLAVIALQPERAFLRHLSKLVSTGMLFCPMPYSPKELYHLIAAKLKKINASRYNAVVKTHIHRKFEQKRKRAQAFRAFSDRITDPAKRSAHVTYKRFDTPHMTSEIREYIDALQGPVIVRAGMGSGKSKHLLRPFMQSSDRGVAIAHRVSLIGGLWGMMNKDDNDRIIKTDILHYQDQGAKELAPYANKLAICINSTVKPCWRPLMAKHDFFGLDEATQGLRAILSGKAMANPVDVFNRIIDSIATTEDHAVLLDADANDLLVELCELALARREHLGLSPWTQIHVVELPVDVTYEKEEKRVARRVLYTDTNRIMVEVLKAAGADEKFLLATDSTNFAEQLLLQLRERWPEKKWLYVSQDTKPDEEVQRFTNAPDEMALRYDGLIYSPAISSGVSIEKPHFTRHFGSFCGQVVPSDAIQMLRRDRTATEFVIGLSQMPGRREENAESIRRGFLQALLDTAEINNAFTDAFLDGNRLSLGLADTTYVRMKMKVAAMEAQARNDFANNLICILFDDGYDVHHLAADEQISALGKAIRKDSKGRVWDLAVQRHLEIETPSDEMKDQLLAKHALSETERAQLTRWEIEHELKLPVTEQSLKFLSDAGKKKLALAELMKMDEMTAARIDREEQSIVFTYHFKRGNENDIVTLTALNRDLADEQFFRMQPLATSITVKSRPLVEVTQRTFATLNRRAARMYFSTCGIDPDTGEGEATPQGMKSAMDLLMNSERRDLFNNVIRFGGYLSKNGKARRPETVFRNICKTFGLGTTKRRQSRSEGLEYVWSITPDSWSFVQEILKRRVEDSLSFFDNRLVVKTEVNDPTCGSNIEIGSQVGSFDMTTTTPFEPIANAVSGLPIPIDWLRSVLTLAELKDLAMLPVRLIRATISGLYMSEHMDQLTAGQYDELKHLRAV